MSCYKTKESPGDTSWFTADRFGMFIHWGLYSMPARNEWIKSIERISEDKYQLYFDHFDPDLFDPKAWAKSAKDAGMKYAVLTTKHHDGFCLFDSQYTEYKSTNTPAKRDLVREFVDAFRAEGLRIGFYYSLLDWSHPHFTIDLLHPRRDDPDALEQNKGRDMRIYAQYMRDQIAELLTNYGNIDILWLDFSYSDYEISKFVSGEGREWQRGKGKDDWEAEKLIATIRQLQPRILINNRTELDQDIWTPEQYQVRDWVRHPQTNELVTWEACQTFSGSWGYHRDESTWKSPEMLIRMLINTVSCGGNLLMNVGPTPRGVFDPRAQAALKVYENWMRYNSRSIYKCTMAEPELLATCPADCRYTQSEDGKRLYIHMFAYPFKYLEIDGLVGKIKYAQFLHDGSEVLMRETKSAAAGDTTTQGNDTLILELPAVKPDVPVPVIELFLR